MPLYCYQNWCEKSGLRGVSILATNWRKIINCDDQQICGSANQLIDNTFETLANSANKEELKSFPRSFSI